MSSSPELTETLRDAIIAKPDAVLEDPAVMNALIAANDQAMGSNIIDLRGIAMDRLETRLDRLENTHRSVIAAAYENIAGTSLVHRAILRMMESADFETFLRDLGGEVAETLRVDAIHLVLESAQLTQDPTIGQLDSVLRMVEPGFTETYCDDPQGRAPKPVLLRQIPQGDVRVYGRAASWVRSEACLRLDFGAGRLPGLLVMGAEDTHRFAPQQGIDLLTFFAGVFERTMRHWLS